MFFKVPLYTLNYVCHVDQVLPCWAAPEYEAKMLLNSLLPSRMIQLLSTLLTH